jgi:hypothetical protein
VIGVFVILLQVQGQEDLPHTLEVSLLLAVFFISVEFFATLLGFALIGDNLGLRPSISREKQPN